MQTIKLRASFFLLLPISFALAQAQYPAHGFASSMAYQPVQSDNTKSATTAVNTFGLKLLGDVAGHNSHNNVFISPLSVFVALSMTEMGAAGKTRDAMRQTLAVPGSLSEEALHESTSALLKSLTSQKGVELSIANALWSDTQWPLAAAFIEQARKFYEADVTTLDFSAPAAANTVNGWVSEKTHGKISNIVTPDIVRAAKAILTNAIYFKGRWEYQFDKDETKPGTFHLAGGRKKQAPMMHRSYIEDAYRSGDGFEAAALPYENSSMRLYAILPAPGKSPEQALAKISIDKLRASAEHTELELRLPKFTLDFEVALKDALEHMGMSIAFYAGADFTPMGSRQFYLGDVLHKTRLEVDEEGTVAAAATAVIAKPTAIMSKPPKKKVLVFDRPFALLLCDQTGAILFAGVIYDPR